MTERAGRIPKKPVRQKHFPSFRPWEEPQTQTSITSRREACSSEYHLTATNGLEPIQATEAWRTAGREETGTANTQEKPFWGHWGGGQPKTQEAAARSKTLGERREGSRTGRKPTGPSQIFWPTADLQLDPWVVGGWGEGRPGCR